MTDNERIKAARIAQGLTQQELAQRLSVTQSTIQQYESGKRNPKFETLQRIALALEISVFSLKTDEKEYQGSPVIFGDPLDEELVMVELSRHEGAEELPSDSDILQEERSMIGKYRKCDVRGKENIHIVINTEYDRAVNSSKKVI